MYKLLKHHSVKVFLGALATLMVACADSGTETVETSVRSVPDTDSVDVAPTSPNSAFLEWDAVPDSNLRGYRDYYGPDPDMYLQFPGQGIDVGNVTSHTVTGLVSGRRYYFAVTAVDHSGNESEFSEQVYKDIP